ncbi:MAG: glucokinase [Deltaproteobacteria bacterium]|nr:glucokinase [Deltaproteobacteria bacterium]MBW2014179.1 glucokinase [Deltaproteobacteria bacterium]MBW2319753.1 glucokinase [Deltaproteobacteria bacterium]
MNFLRNRLNRTFYEFIKVNDLTATAMAIPLLNSDEFFPLNQAEPIKGRNLALIAPGTGLGIAMLIYQNDQYLPIPSGQSAGYIKTFIKNREKCHPAFLLQVSVSPRYMPP